MSGEAKARIVQILNEEGCAPGSSLHSFRCTFPAGKPPCDCVELLAQRILDEVVLPVAQQIVVSTMPKA